MTAHTSFFFHLGVIDPRSRCYLAVDHNTNVSFDCRTRLAPITRSFLRLWIFLCGNCF